MEHICKRTSCNCRVRDDELFCADDCKAVTSRADPDDADQACSCGHPDCYRQSDSSLISELEAP